MPHGTIKSLINNRGFGSIRVEGAPLGTKHLAFRHVDIQGIRMEDLQVGQLVEYDLLLDQARGTPRAGNVRVGLVINA